MSAPNIPNLLSMRGGLRGRGRGRGRGHRGGPPNPRPHTTQPAANNDHAIQSTDTDAAVSRLSAVSLGYLEDPFARYFVTGQPVRRLPVINRGTYTRTTTLDTLVDAFLSSTTPQPASYPSPTRQIISLGAGTDTRYFRLRAQNRHQHLIYHEFDFPSVVAAKKKIVESNNLFGDEFLYENVPKDEAIVPDEGDEAPPSHQWGLLRDINGQQVPRYLCHPIDLRKLPQEKCLAAYEAIRIGIPTLLISECCLCYLEVDAANAATKWFADRIPDLGIVLYEPIGTDDSFGQMMVSNLASRGIVMPTVQKYKTLEDQRARLVDLKFGDGQEARSIETIWEDWVSQQEKERVDGLEGLDEVEEWLLLARHYAITWGWRGVGFEGWKGISGAANN